MVDKLKLTRVEMGQILRNAAASKTKVGETIKGYQNRGELVPDEYTHTLLNAYVTTNDSKVGYLFDGFPRTLDQYKAVKEILDNLGQKIDKVINLYISEEETIRRLSSRRVCPNCKEVWNTITKPSPKGDLCGKCGHNLVHREDDKPDAIRKRLEWSKSKVGPVIEKAREEGLLVEVNGEQSIEAVHKDLMSKLQDL